MTLASARHAVRFAPATIASLAVAAAPTTSVAATVTEAAVAAALVVVVAAASVVVVAASVAHTVRPGFQISARRDNLTY